MKIIMAIMTALASTLASAQDWTHEMTKDAFSDEEIWVASVHLQVEGQQFTLFVNCRDDGPVNVGLTGTDIGLIDGEQAHSRTYYRIPVRFDDDEPGEEHFVDQGDVMFLAMAPLIVPHTRGRNRSSAKRPVGHADRAVRGPTTGSVLRRSPARIGKQATRARHGWPMNHRFRPGPVNASALRGHWPERLQLCAAPLP